MKSNSEIRKEVRRNINFQTLLTFFSLNILLLLSLILPTSFLILSTLAALTTGDTSLLNKLPILFIANLPLLLIISPTLILKLYRTAININRGNSSKFKDNLISFRQIFTYWGIILITFAIKLFAILSFNLLVLLNKVALDSVIVTSLILFLLSFFLLVIKITFPFAIYVVADYEYCAPFGSLDRYCSLIKGNITNILGMLVSFIPWIILGLISFGVTFIWIIPYMILSLTSLYNEISQRLDYDDYDDYKKDYTEDELEEDCEELNHYETEENIEFIEDDEFEYIFK